MSLEDNLALASDAIEYVAGLGISSSNKISHRLKESGGVDAVIGTGQGTRTGDLGIAGQKVGWVRYQNQGLDNYRTMADNAVAAQSGNCGELAIVAALRMYDQGGTPLHLMYFTAAGYDHMWATIGVHAGADPVNMRSWGKEAVWVDPWQGDEGMCFSISDFVAGRVRNLNAIFKCNTVERVEAGVPTGTCVA